MFRFKGIILKDNLFRERKKKKKKIKKIKQQLIQGVDHVVKQNNFSFSVAL